MSDVVLPDFVQRELEDFTDQTVRRLRPKVSPEILWHYTSADALLEIVESGELFATQMACMNDEREFRYALELFREASRERIVAMADPTDADVAFFECIAAHTHPDLTRSVGLFVTCFSRKADDLSQWRAYSNGGENGYSIGFYGTSIWEAGNLLGSRLQAVQYDQDVAKDLAESVLEMVYRLFVRSLAERGSVPLELWTKALLEAAWAQLHALAAILKDPAFEDEEEWRALRWFNDDDIHRMQFVVRRSMISRHLPLRFPPPRDLSVKRLPIAKIIVGPSRHKDVSAVAVGDLLLKHGYENAREIVVTSDVPFQAL